MRFGRVLNCLHVNREAVHSDQATAGGTGRSKPLITVRAAPRERRHARKTQNCKKDDEIYSYDQRNLSFDSKSDNVPANAEPKQDIPSRSAWGLNCPVSILSGDSEQFRTVGTLNTVNVRGRQAGFGDVADGQVVGFVAPVGEIGTEKEPVRAKGFNGAAQ